MTRDSGAQAVAGTALDESTKLDVATLRELSRLRPSVTAFHIVLELVAIIFAALLCERYFGVVTYLLAVAFIGGRQHALISLIHEGIHRRIARSRRWNDGLSEAMVLPFLLLDYAKLRDLHLQHHRFANTDRDPDWLRKRDASWEFPKPRGAMIRLLVADLVGFGFVRVIVQGHAFEKRQAAESSGASPASPKPPAGRSRALLLRVAFLALVIGSGLGKAYVLYFIVPFLTWLQLCIHLRSVAEHFGIFDRLGVFKEHRTTLTNWVGRVFFVQKNLNYHIEHHLYPAVPFYRLPALHDLLMQRPVYATHAHVTRGYFRVIGECIQGSKLPVGALSEHD